MPPVYLGAGPLSNGLGSSLTYKDSTIKRVQNVGTLERWIRILGGGLAALVGALLLLAGPGSLLLGLASGLLVVLGLDLFVTGLTGYCPLYHRLGWSTVRSKPHVPR